MALSRTTLLGAISNASGNFGAGAYTTASFTPPDSCLLGVALEAIENGGTGTLITNLTVADSVGLTWTQRINAVTGSGGFDTVTCIYTAPVGTGVSMTITFGAGALNVGEYAVTVMAWTGYDATTPVGATGSNFKTTGFVGPPDPGTLTLSGAPAATSDVFASVGMDKSVAGTTPGSGWTEIHDFHNTDWGGMESQVRGGSTSTSVDWVDLRPGGGALFNYAAVAVEVKEAAAAAVAVARPVMGASGAAMRAGSW